MTVHDLQRLYDYGYWANNRILFYYGEKGSVARNNQSKAQDGFGGPSSLGTVRKSL